MVLIKPSFVSMNFSITFEYYFSTNKEIQAADDISRIDLYRWSTQISKAMEFLASKKVTQSLSFSN